MPDFSDNEDIGFTEEEAKEILQDFHDKFIASQEPLGEEFQKVINDNIWDLYQESQENLREFWDWFEEPEKIFTYQGNNYKVKRNWGVINFTYVIYRKDSLGSWVFRYLLAEGECETAEEAIKKFIEQEENKC